MVFAVVRIRGSINIKPDIKKTLQLLSLTRSNHCVLLEENPVNKGMLQIVKDAGFTGYIGIEYEGSELSESKGIEATRRLLIMEAEKL